jgi:hypothetical protein
MLRVGRQSQPAKMLAPEEQNAYVPSTRWPGEIGKRVGLKIQFYARESPAHRHLIDTFSIAFPLHSIAPECELIARRQNDVGRRCHRQEKRREYAFPRRSLIQGTNNQAPWLSYASGQESA